MTATFDLGRPRRVHLVGVGGAGMSGIARMLLQSGHQVSGSDRQPGPVLEALRALGGQIHVGHAAESVAGAEAVVTSTAIPSDNVELVAAQQQGSPILHRSEMLAALMAPRRAVLVAGTHGKTTTTSMAVVALQGAGADPSFAIGGALNEAGSNAHAGSGALFVAEADESDRSFLAYDPDLVVVTNIELDHPDVFADLDEVHAAFDAFLARRASEVPAIVCLDDAGGAQLAARATAPVITYGEDPRSDIRVVIGAPGAARLRADGAELVAYSLAVPGRHNLLNAAAALAVCRWAGVDLDAAAAALRTFTGAMRRFQRLGTVAGVEVVEDYAHHPTEVRATLAAAREVTSGRVLLVVQPHRFSRILVLGAELGRAAAAADVVVVTEIYGADEEPVPGVSGALVAEAARDAGANVVWQPHLGDVAAELAALAEPGDLVLITGAGDVSQVGPALLARLGEPSG